MGHKREYREGMDMVPGHTAAARHLNRHSGNHRAAWDGLGIFDLETADQYLADLALKVANRSDKTERANGVIEVAQMFAMTVVLADREREERECLENPTQVMSSKEEEASGDDPASR